MAPQQEMAGRGLRLVVFDLCGTLSRGASSFDVPHNLRASQLDAFVSEGEYWEMVGQTWGQCSTTTHPFRQAALQWIREERGDSPGIEPALDAFLALYWKSHAIEPEWQDLLAGHRIVVAVSADLGFPKKAPGFWQQLLQHRTSQLEGSLFVVASDHYSEARGVIEAVLPESCSVGDVQASGDMPTLAEVVSDVILIDDFGAAEQAASGYAERRRVTEEAVTSVLPPQVPLRTVAIRPEEHTAVHAGQVLGMIRESVVPSQSLAEAEALKCA